MLKKTHQYYTFIIIIIFMIGSITPNREALRSKLTHQNRNLGLKGLFNKIENDIKKRKDRYKKKFGGSGSKIF